jgi:hypothetical protein
MWYGSCGDAFGSSVVNLTAISSSNTPLTGQATTCFTLTGTPEVNLNPCSNFIVIGFKGNGGSFGAAQITWTLKVG